MKKRPMKISSVQSINPPCGVSRSTLEPSSAANAGVAEPRSRTSEKSEARMMWRRVGETCTTARPGRAVMTVGLDLVLQKEGDDDAEERAPLDERGENQRRRLDATRRFRLARHPFNRLAADAA